MDLTIAKMVNISISKNYVFYLVMNWIGCRFGFYGNAFTGGIAATCGGNDFSKR